MEYMYKLKEKLCDELEEIVNKGEWGAGDLDIIHKLTETIKNLVKIKMLEEHEGYSSDGNWEADMRGTYGRGSSYRGRKRDSMGRYSRDGRGGYSRDDGYSRHNAKDGMMMHLHEMMEEAEGEREREKIRRFMEQMESV